MYRSGTSMAANILGDLGAYIESDKFPPDRMNEKGYWESKELSDINIGSLKAAGFDEFSPPPLFSGWEKVHAVDEYRQRVSRFAERMGEHDVWAAKHPATTVAFPLWEPCLPRDTRFIVCIRDPISVAKSIEQWGFNHHRAGTLWMAYTLAALVYTSQKKRLLLFYEDFAVDPTQQTCRIKEFADLEGVVPTTYDNSLAHQRPDEGELLRDPSVPMGTKLLYRTLLESKSDPTTLVRLEADIIRAGAAGTVHTWTAEEYGDAAAYHELQTKYDKLRNSTYVKLGRRLKHFFGYKPLP
jgi:hypothetical protein